MAAVGRLRKNENAGSVGEGIREGEREGRPAVYVKLKVIVNFFLSYNLPTCLYTILVNKHLQC